MASLFKKVTSTVSAFAVVATAVGSTLTASAASEFAAHADALAAAGYINTQTTEAGYRLGDNITRAEMAKIAVKLNGAEVATATDAMFSDVTTAKLGDLASYVETAANAGIVSKANAKFRPLDLVTRAEMVKMLMAAKGVATTETSAGFADVDSSLGDLAGYINAAAAEGYISTGTSFRPNATATRGEAFKVAAGVAGVMDEEDDTDLGDLFGTGVTSTGSTSTGTTTTPVIVKAGSLGVFLSAKTAAAANLPKGAAGVSVASFDLTAGSADVTVSSLVVKQVGLGDGTLLSDIAVFTENGRTSKVKSNPFNNSDKQTTLVLTNGLVVKAGSTETISLVASVSTSATASQEFALEIANAEAVSSTAETISATFPVVAATHKVAAVGAGQVKVEADGAPSQITLGDKNVEIAKFKLSEDSSNKESILVSNITLKEEGTVDENTDLANFELYADGVKVASMASTNDKYVTFNLATPVSIKDGGNVKFSVRADVIGGPAKTVNLILDNKLDVSAVGSLYNVGVAVNATAGTSFSNSGLTVKAGEIAVSYQDAEATQFLKDKKDIVLGKFTVTNTKGKALEITAINLTVESNFTGSVVSNLIENVEIYDESVGTVYDLATSATGASETFSDTSLSIALGTSKTFVVRADSKDVAFTTGQKLNVKLSNLGSSANSAGILIKETADDNVVTDVTPSAISYKALEAVTASATLTALPLSTSKTAVVGSKDVEALSFEVKAGDASALKLREVRVAKDSGTLGFTNTGVTAVKLYKDSVSDANLIKQVGGSSIAAGVVNFDSILVDIAKNQTQKFVVTVSIVDDQALNTLTLKLRVAATNGLDLEDYDNDDVAATGTAVSARLITVTGVGTLAVVTDLADSKADKEKSVLAGTTSAEVAAIKLTATNEAVTARDIKVTLTGAVAANNTVGSVSLYKKDGSLIASKSVTSNEVLFEDVNYAVAEGSETIYVKVVTNKVGKDQVGADAVLQALVEVTDAEGVSSKKVITASTNSTYSKAFAVSSVRVSAVAFVDSYAGVARATKLTSGANNLAILAVTADNTANTLSGSAEVLKTQIDALKLQLDQVVASGATSLTIEKIGGSGTGASLAVSGNVASGSLAGLGTDAEIAAGETVYFLVKGSITLDTGIAGNESVQVSLADLNNAAVTYSDNDIGAAITALRLSTTKLDGAKISD